MVFVTVTQILFDPRVDLPGGGTTPLAVTIKATPLRIRDENTSTVYPSNVTYTGITAATPFALNSTDGTWAWSIGVYDSAAQRARVLDHRTVAVTGSTVNWANLVDVDPDTFDSEPPQPAWSAALAAQAAAVAAAYATKPVALTQAAYDALATKNPSTLYLITD